MTEENVVLLVLASVVIMLLFAVTVIWFLNQTQKKITEAKIKEQEKELKYQNELLSNTVRTQENERGRIARELHDDVTSKLNIIHLNMHLLKQKVFEDKETNVIINQIESSLSKSIERSRKISHELMPVVLKKFGLTHALNELLTEVNNTAIFDLQFLGHEDVQIEDDVKSLHSFRIIQELVNNAIKYSKANQVKIEFSILNDMVKFNYLDDGVGVKENEVKTGLGFSSINTRIRLLGGSMNFIENIEKTGLHIQFNFPYND